MKTKTSIIFFCVGFLLLLLAFALGFISLTSSYQLINQGSGINYFGFSVVSLSESVRVFLMVLTFISIFGGFACLLSGFFFYVKNKQIKPKKDNKKKSQ